MIIAGTSDPDVLRGWFTYDVLQGFAGDDHLIADGANDILIGGLGNDLLEGGAGDDMYIFELGDGVDTIIDNQGANQLVLSSVAEGSVSLSLGSLLIRVGENGDAIHWQGFDPDNAAQSPGLASIRFAGGKTLSYAALIAKGFDIDGTQTDDYLSGTSVHDRLSGKDGDDTILGGTGDDVLDGGNGNDTLVGGAGSDIYKFASGSGQDIIQEADIAGDINEIIMDNGVLAADLNVTRNADDLVLDIAGTQDSITIEGWYRATYRPIARLSFADGTQWDAATLESRTSGSVNHPPVLVSEVPDQLAPEGATFAFTLPSGTFSDVDANDILSYSASLEGGGALPDWLVSPRKTIATVLLPIRSIS
jgi:Ca2+-binding RTX toxin-like protein